MIDCDFWEVIRGTLIFIILKNRLCCNGARHFLLTCFYYYEQSLTKCSGTACLHEDGRPTDSGITAGDILFIASPRCHGNGATCVKVTRPTFSWMRGEHYWIEDLPNSDYLLVDRIRSAETTWPIPKLLFNKIGWKRKTKDFQFVFDVLMTTCDKITELILSELKRKIIKTEFCFSENIHNNLSITQ